jgi:hypothetical protein
VNRAIYIVRRPGKDVLACEEHAAKLHNLARRSMGFSASLTACWVDTACTNCENEAARAAILPPAQKEKICGCGKAMGANSTTCDACLEAFGSQGNGERP